MMAATAVNRPPHIGSCNWRFSTARLPWHLDKVLLLPVLVPLLWLYMICMMGREGKGYHGMDEPQRLA
jgi:hypothetical protein